MLIFAGLGYALEKDEEDTEFYTLPQTLYWAIITMTSTGTVGELNWVGTTELHNFLAVIQYSPCITFNSPPNETGLSWTE